MKHKLNAIIEARIESIFEKIKAYREYLHQHPELSFQEFETMEFVAQKLTELGIPFEKNVAGTGVVGLIISSKHTESDNCIGLRADLDALPILEETDVDYKSKNVGVMHACGHDVHTSILLGAAEILNEIKEELPQPVKLIFQPGEETNPGGASLMIAAGILENPKVERMYALHVFPEMEAGKVGLRSGLYMASSDEIHIQIDGIGGHGALPEKCVNPLMMGAEFVLKASELIKRECPTDIPCVLSLGRFEALGSTNVIPSSAEIKGTFRTMNEEWRSEAHELLHNLAVEISEKYNGKINFKVSKGYPFLKNDEVLTSDLRQVFKDNLGGNFVHELPIRMTAEDFAFYSQKIPVCFFRLGVGNEKERITFGVHHPKFNIDSNALKTGIHTMVLAALQ
ncbi:MAG: amidohydrolase [Flavobacteriales bacterium]|nr:amidohydrolase [Crocinitomicaceae bacterium]NBX79633.1 amidohydrolase [Flavobacteriales bacterium]